MSIEHPSKWHLPEQKRLWNEGANYTSDAIITRKNAEGKIELLTILRPNGRWALPGGFRDVLKEAEHAEEGEVQKVEREPSDLTMFRELEEETGLTGLGKLPLKVAYQGLSKDDRTEGTPGEPGSRWIETTAYHIDVTGVPDLEPQPTAHEVEERGVTEAKFQIVTEELLDSLHSNHGEMVRDALHDPVDRKAPEILDALQEARLYQKQGIVRARRATPGESISTRMQDGKVEVEANIAKEGDWVVTNPGGEEYLIPQKKFDARYEVTSEVGVYRAKGRIRAIPNPYGKNVRIVPEWGGKQYGDADCFFADICDEKGNLAGEPYIIKKTEFEETYKPA